MKKLDFILLIIGSNLPMAAQLLRAKDSNSTGNDDLAADLLEWSGQVLQSLQFNLPFPEPPASLKDKFQPKVETEVEGTKNGKE